MRKINKGKVVLFLGVCIVPVSCYYYFRGGLPFWASLAMGFLTTPLYLFVVAVTIVLIQWVSVLIDEITPKFENWFYREP